MPRDRTRRDTTVAVVLAVVLAPVLAVVVAGGGGGGDGPAPQAAPIAAVELTDLDTTAVERFDGPGYLAWTGAWETADGDLMASYTKGVARSGDGSDRERVPPEVLEAFGVDSVPDSADFWGVDLVMRFQQYSADGQRWTHVRDEPFRALLPQAVSAQPTFELPDGTLIRRVNGDDLRHRTDIPHTAYLQRLRPGSKTWEGQQVLLDPERFTYQLTRIRQLGDGRLIATGNAWDVPTTTKPGDRTDVPSRFILFVSSDQGQSWREAMTIPEGTGELPGNEWDTAELANGDLAAVMRTYTDNDRDEAIAKIATLEREGDGWVMRHVEEAPFPVSGHPELITTAEGAVLSIATTGVEWTQDGRTWEAVAGTDYRSHYYPRAVQLRDGTIHVISQLGGDDPFRTGRHGILDDAFRIRVTREGGS